MLAGPGRFQSLDSAGMVDGDNGHWVQYWDVQSYCARIAYRAALPTGLIRRTSVRSDWARAMTVWGIGRTLTGAVEHVAGRCHHEPPRTVPITASPARCRAATRLNRLVAVQPPSMGAGRGPSSPRKGSPVSIYFMMVGGRPSKPPLRPTGSPMAWSSVAASRPALSLLHHQRASRR